MSESIIGTILLAASEKRNFTIYHVMFTDNRVLAIEAQLQDTQGGGMPNPFANHPVVGFLAEAAVMGAMSGGRGMNIGAPSQMAKMQGVQRWQSMRAAAAGKPVVDYKQKTVTDDMLSVGSVSIPYQNIKQVTFKKGMGSPDFNLNFGEGLMNSENFMVQGDAANAVIDLIKKTPLAQKFKQ